MDHVGEHLGTENEAEEVITPALWARLGAESIMRKDWAIEDMRRGKSSFLYPQGEKMEQLRILAKYSEREWLTQSSVRRRIRRRKPKTLKQLGFIEVKRPSY
mmetsp:Transcript_4202/g.3083  ORF Transcript_4202/g.3083 Transcript_4202/m.3083 type:complete len:102 (-) Transcript_4202:47-352(-)|eukprot:CAMPEP_0202972388 /NCGR_PEP_ID=MMETSP1396-20130829/36039_1 /ASSEMBLY_ACC=CAM_ASM_000872 /TAXON_ID= /ORGANISM="Pseudokeronopsis sp., Strain Brazil" /LENGTH=101 /DNA_ID=CAMNT_0049702731 /DNA_START=481 /DNA_END=786 /DNA_ORIENTATION=+